MYKERLRTKYVKGMRPGDNLTGLHGSNWTFIKDGLDDFRDGLPPDVGEDDIFLKGNKGVGPALKGNSDILSRIKQRAGRHRFNYDEICFSKVTPLQAQRREHIQEIEYGLTQHPLALYPHLEECLPPDVFEDVVDILDPEMNLVEDEEPENTIYEDAEDAEEVEEGEEGEGLQKTPSPLAAYQSTERMEHAQESEEPRVRNPYRWLPRKDEKDKKDKKKTTERRSSSPSQDEHIKHVTTDFCQWVASLGGESNNIEESTITSLFASGYETKPALSVPIHVVELTNVPPELRMTATISKPDVATCLTPEQPDQKQTDWKSATPSPASSPKPLFPSKKREKKPLSEVQQHPTRPCQGEQKYLGKYEPSWVKFKYGAWYLKPQSWKKRNPEEPLQDPQEIKDQQMSEAKKKSKNLDQELAPMHGVKAFVDFIDKKTVRKPEFLERVGEIQEEQAQAAQDKLEAEVAKQKKRDKQTKSAARSSCI